MDQFTPFAEPWWVNLLLLVPVIAFFLFRKDKLNITKQQLFIAAIFGIAFGFVEASVVVYLRAALGLLPGYMGSLSDVIQQSPGTYQQIQALTMLPKSLLTVEVLRETATMIVLITVAALSANKLKEQFAMFLWVFAFWDIFYYVGLWVTVRWPYSLITPDILFLIPTPWISQVWFPYLVSSLTAIVVALNIRNSNPQRK